MSRSSRRHSHFLSYFFISRPCPAGQAIGLGSVARTSAHTTCRGWRKRPVQQMLLLYLLFGFLSFEGHAGAQVALGQPSFVPEACYQYDCVNLLNNNIILNVPVFSKPGVFPLTFNIWGNVSYVYVLPASVNNPTEWVPNTWLTGNFGNEVDSPNYNGGVNEPCPGGSPYTNTYTNWAVHTVDGATHLLPSTDYVDMKTDGSGVSCYNSSFTDPVTDGTGYTLNVSVSGGEVTATVYTRSGMQVAYYSATDRNGNSITWNYAPGTFTDTLGLTALTLGARTDCGEGYPCRGQWTDVNGGSPGFSWAPTYTAPLRTAFGCTSPNISDYNEPTGGAASNTLTLADGTSLKIAEEGTPGYSGYYTGRIGELNLPQGGTISYAYGGGHNGIDCTYQTADVVTRTLGNGDQTTYTLAYSLISGSNYKVTNTVQDPGGNQTVYQFTGLSSTGNQASPISQVVTQIKRYQGTVSSGTLLATDVYCYNGSFATCSTGTAPTATVTSPVRDLVVFHQVSGMSNWSATETQYDKYGNATLSAQYDFGGTSPVRETDVTYYQAGTSCGALSSGSYINDKPCEEKLLQNGSTVADVKYTYSTHGNLLTTSVWTGSSWIGQASLNTYNSNGTPITTYDIANNPTTYGYSSGSYTSCGSCTEYPFPTSITKGGLVAYATWNGVGGVKLSDTDANGAMTTYCYNTGSTCPGGTADPFWRIMSVTDPLENEVFKTYPNGTSPDASNSTFTFNSGSSIQNTTVTTDGYGRTTNVQKQQSPTATQYDTTTTTYGWSSHYRTVATSQPCSEASGGSCTTVHTNYFDPLGRLNEEATTSNETLQHTYTQNDDLEVLGPAPTIDGEHTKQVQKQYDGLGRLQYSCMIGNGSSTACGQNSGSQNGVTDAYTYTQGTGGTEVKVQRGGSSGQAKTFYYDALGRLSEKLTPETGASSWRYYYDSVPLSPTCPHGYQGIVGQLEAIRDPNGNQICYAYDSLGRVTVIWANGTTCRHFYYDTTYGTVPSGVTTPTFTLGRLAEATTDNCSGTLITDEWFSYNKNGDPIDLWETTPNAGHYFHSVATFAGNHAVLTTHLEVPSLITTTYTLDGEGRWNGASNNSGSGVTVIPSLPGVTYNAASQPTNVPLGSSTDYDSYTYDAYTGRMKTWLFQVGTGSSNQENAILSWNPIGSLQSLAITDDFHSVGTQTCNFGTSSPVNMGYDDWNRLLYDDCGSGNWGQSFTYDSNGYDNLTKTPLSGHTGTTFNPGYNLSNNQYAGSYTASYDHNGNQIYDPSNMNTYSWNEFSKMASIDKVGTNCATSGTCITYDAFGRVVEIDSGTTYTEIFYTQVGKALQHGTTEVYSYWGLPGGGTQVYSGSTGYMHKDWLGSARLMSSITAQTVTYDQALTPYGEQYAASGSVGTQAMFMGTTQDISSGTSGLWDTSNRELGSSPSRWLSPDPAGAGWNQYAYVTNPNSESDPSGLRCDTPGCNQGGFGALTSVGYLDNIIDMGPSAEDLWIQAAMEAGVGGPQPIALSPDFFDFSTRATGDPTTPAPTLLYPGESVEASSGNDDGSSLSNDIADIDLMLVATDPAHWAITNAVWTSKLGPPTCVVSAITTHCFYPVTDNCTASTSPPDNSMTGEHVWWTTWGWSTGNYSYMSWNVYSHCTSTNGHQPWNCSYGYAGLVSANAPIKPQACTHTP
jgi:YD repeat-containing protein